MENVLAAVVGWFSHHNIQLKNINLTANPKGQVETCSGVLTKEIPDPTHRKLLEREFKRQLKETDFRFCKSTITIYKNSFTILSPEAKFMVGGTLEDPNPALEDYMKVLKQNA